MIKTININNKYLYLLLLVLLVRLPFFSEVLIALSIVFSGILLVDFKSDSQTKNYIGNAKIIKEKKRKFNTILEIYRPIFISQKSVKIKVKLLVLKIILY